MKRETINRHARAVWRVGYAAAVVGALPCALLSALGLGRGAVAGACGALSLAGCLAAIVAGALCDDL